MLGNSQVPGHPNLTRESQTAAGLVRREREAPALAARRLALDLPFDGYRTGAAGAHSFAVEPARIAVVGRHAGSQEHVAQPIPLLTLNASTLEMNNRHYEFSDNLRAWSATQPRSAARADQEIVRSQFVDTNER